MTNLARFRIRSGPFVFRKKALKGGTSEYPVSRTAGVFFV